MTGPRLISPALDQRKEMMMKEVWVGKKTTEKAQEAIDAVEVALFDTLGPVPLVVALGVLRLVEKSLIDQHSEGQDGT